MRISLDLLALPWSRENRSPVGNAYSLNSIAMEPAECLCVISAVINPSILLRHSATFAVDDDLLEVLRKLVFYRNPFHYLLAPKADNLIKLRQFKQARI